MSITQKSLGRCHVTLNGLHYRRFQVLAEQCPKRKVRTSKLIIASLVIVLPKLIDKLGGKNTQFSLNKVRIDPTNDTVGGPARKVQIYFGNKQDVFREICDVCHDNDVTVSWVIRTCMAVALGFFEKYVPEGKPFTAFGTRVNYE